MQPRKQEFHLKIGALLVEQSLELAFLPLISREFAEAPFGSSINYYNSPWKEIEP